MEDNTTEARLTRIEAVLLRVEAGLGSLGARGVSVVFPTETEGKKASEAAKLWAEKREKDLEERRALELTESPEDVAFREFMEA